MKHTLLFLLVLYPILLFSQKIDTIKVKILVNYDRNNTRPAAKWIDAYEIRQTNICPECVYPSYYKIGFLTIDKEPIPYEWLIWKWIDKTDLNCPNRENKPPYN